MRHIVVYISGKYSGEIEKNIQKAREMAIQVWEAGFSCICPHNNTIHFELDCNCTYEDYIEGDLAILNGCDAILMLDEWGDSKGAIIERDFAIDKHLNIFYSLNELKAFYEVRQSTGLRQAN